MAKKFCVWICRSDFMAPHSGIKDLHFSNLTCSKMGDAFHLKKKERKRGKKKKEKRKKGRKEERKKRKRKKERKKEERDKKEKRKEKTQKQEKQKR